MRAASAPAERDALFHRYTDVLSRAEHEGRAASVREFEQAVQDQSRAVIYRSVGTVHRLLGRRAPPLVTFYREVHEFGRQPEDNPYDRFRTSVDNLFFPHYFAAIYFAGLSLDAGGATSYGGAFPCAFILNTERIRERASVFEENTYVFCDQRRHPVTQPIPPGHRATWDNRHVLAVVKLADRIGTGTKPDDFPRLLVSPRGSTGTDEFVEVHIHDPIEPADIREFVSSNPILEDDRIILQDVIDRLTSLGVPCRAT